MHTRARTHTSILAHKQPNTHTHTHTHTVEDDAERVAAAKKDIDELGLEDVRVVPSARYSDVLSDRFVRVVIIGLSLSSALSRALSGTHTLSRSLARSRSLLGVCTCVTEATESGGCCILVPY